MADRVDYEFIAPEAHKLLDRLLSVSDNDEAIRIYREYIDFLNMNGWTNDEFDAETLERVNKSWETKPTDLKLN